MKKYVVNTAQSPPWTSWSHTQKTQTYDAVRAAGDEGITREDICKATGLPKQRVWFYLSELRRAGLIKRMGDAIDVANLSAEDAKLYALNVLESALVSNAAEHLNTCTTCKPARSEDRRCEAYRSLSVKFARYQKIKALAIGAKTRGEEAAALRAAVVDLVKLVF